MTTFIILKEFELMLEEEIKELDMIMYCVYVLAYLIITFFIKSHCKYLKVSIKQCPPGLVVLS